MTRMFENALKTVESQDASANAVIPTAYDMTIEDLNGLHALVRSDGSNGLYRALIMAFKFGFVMGNRATHSRNIRRL